MTSLQGPTYPCNASVYVKAIIIDISWAWLAKTEFLSVFCRWPQWDLHEGTKIIIIKFFHLLQIKGHSTDKNDHILGKYLQCPRYQPYRNCDFTAESYQSEPLLSEYEGPLPSFLSYSYSCQRLSLTNESIDMISLWQCSKGHKQYNRL